MRSLAFACLAAAAVLSGCNDDNNGITNPGGTGGTSATPTPSPGCTQTTVASATRTVGRNVLDSVPFSTSGAGRLDITVDWRDAAANVGAFLVAAGSCSQTQFNNQACSVLVDSGGDKPHWMSANVPAGSYEVLINNFGGTPANVLQPVTVQVVLSVGCPAPPAPAPTAAPSPSPSPTPTPTPSPSPSPTPTSSR